MPTSWTRETTLGTSTSSMSVTTLTTTGNVTVGGTLTSTGTITGTLVTAAQGNITSVGTLTTLTVDNVIVNGTTIGHTSDTDLMTLASGALTVSELAAVGLPSLLVPYPYAVDDHQTKNDNFCGGHGEPSFREKRFIHLELFII